VTRPSSLAFVLSFASVVSSSRAWAQGAADAGARAPADAGGPATDAAAGSAPAGLEMPRVRALVDLVVPPELRASAPASIPLRLTLDTEGTVTDAEVLESHGAAFDELARKAARALKFTPARRGGTAIPARIRFVLPLAPPAPVPAPAVAAAPAPVAAGPEAVTDVTVRGASATKRLRESAEAVTVVETERAQREAADLGDVVARAQGVSIRRAGGLGSGARVMLNGLTDRQIRLFLDGVPLDVMGFPNGLQDVPVNLVERIEIFRGVVPIRFGADALGGAMNLVSDEASRPNSAAVSAQLGSFGTARFTALGRITHGPSGLFAAANAFLDHADNDYAVDVEVPDDKGRLSPARAHRFHDAYDAHGGGFEVGMRDRSYAKRLVLRLHGTRMTKELQHNIVMSVPYGEAWYWETTRGVSLRYEQPRLRPAGVGSLFGAWGLLSLSRNAAGFKDLSKFVYDWFGRRIRERVRAGELGEPSNDKIWDYTGLARLGLSFTPTPEHSLRVAIAPTAVDRAGRDALVASGREPLSAARNYLAVTSGLEYQFDLFSRRLESIAFGKSYLYRTSSEENLPGNIFRRLEQKSHHVGVGEQLRLRITPDLLAKASYERATRLPMPYEVFGDGVLLLSNLRLQPERSHNGNLSLVLDVDRSRAGAFRGEVNAFVRHAENLIVLLGNDMTQRYENVYTTRAQGLEGGAGWTSPGGYLAVDANLTWQSVRNASDEGTFKDFKGDRIPNRPWLLFNLAARVQKSNVSSARDELSLGYYLRYINSFFRGWESLGLRAFKQTVPAQTTHALALTYIARGTITQSWAADIQNLTDAKTYDFFGTQRPGRAFSVKFTGEY
jgi:TonB family protein